MKNIYSRRFSLAFLVSLLGITSIASAQEFPNRQPVRLIVTFAVGGGADTVARALNTKLGEVLGQTVVVENKAGAGGNLGAEIVSKSPNDGYTIGFVPAAMGTITPLVYKNPQFNPDSDLTSVATIGTSPLVMVANATSGINTLQDLARFSRANAGKANFAAPQPNSLPHLAGEMVNKAGNMGMTAVPYQAPPAALAGLLGGDVLMTTDGIPGLIGQIKSGRLKALAVTSAQRLPGLDIPTVAETYPGYEAIGWFQIIVPAGTPAAVIDKLNADVNRITNAQAANQLLRDLYGQTN